MVDVEWGAQHVELTIIATMKYFNVFIFNAVGVNQTFINSMLKLHVSAIDVGMI